MSISNDSLVQEFHLINLVKQRFTVPSVGVFIIMNSKQEVLHALCMIMHLTCSVDRFAQKATPVRTRAGELTRHFHLLHAEAS